MKNLSLGGLLHDGKTLILAYDQGFEHGPTDFNEKNINPEYVMDIALEGRFNAFAIHSGIAEKYHVTHFKDVPLIIKLNGKTHYDNFDPVSLQHTSVAYAIKLGAKAVGYTIYLGSSREQEMFKEFGKIVENAHENGIPVVLWVYPRGPPIHNDIDTGVLAYAARIALELGADIVKLKFNGDVKGMKWVVKAAGRTKVVFAGGPYRSDADFLKYAEKAMRAGAVGLAIGRNIWQHENPLELTNALKKVIFHGKTAEAAFAHIKK